MPSTDPPPNSEDPEEEFLHLTLPMRLILSGALSASSILLPAAFINRLYPNNATISFDYISTSLVFLFDFLLFSQAIFQFFRIYENKKRILFLLLVMTIIVVPAFNLAILLVYSGLFSFW